MMVRSDVWQYSSAEQSVSVTIPKTRRVETGIKAKILTLSIPLLLFLAVPYMVNALVEKQGYEVQQIRTHVVKLTKENEALRLEVGKLKSLGRIQRIAETELGMFIPQEALHSSAGTKIMPISNDARAKAIRD